MIFAPHIENPSGSAIFNLGVVTINWSINNPPSDGDPYTDITDSVSYEIEYTDSYRSEDTTWHTVVKRIPWKTTSYTWNVGKMIKSKTIRVRIRARAFEDVSDWSMSDEFAINVFDLVAPAIISPVSDVLYTNFILIILDETVTMNTYHQKVRYTLEYSSQSQNIEWTTIVTDIPVGQNVIRWNIEDVVSSDDYSLRLTAKNASTTCFESTPAQPDQIARTFVQGIRIQQAGLFVIDTKPPEALLEIEGNIKVTNQLKQVITIFAEDNVTDVDHIQLRECDAGDDLELGKQGTVDESSECPAIEIQKTVNNSAKIQWTFEDKSGLKKIEALVTDIGGNNSSHETVKVFRSIFDSDEQINDFIIRVETRDEIIIDDTTDPPGVTVTSSSFEVAYLGNNAGEFWVLEPYPRLIHTFESSEDVVKIADFNQSVLIFTYNSSTDVGKVYRHSAELPALIQTFTSGLSSTTGVAEFNNSLFIGLENGEIWKYDGLTFTSLSLPINDSINTLYGDERYLYAGFSNSSNMLLYNGTTFFTLDMDA